MRTLSALVLLAPLTASAVPTQLSHQGRLFDALATPLTGSHDLTFSIYDAPSGGTPLWTETVTLTLDNGYFQTPLGASGSTTLDDSLFDGGSRYLAIAVDSGPELATRQPIDSVPYAIRAGVADSVDGGVVNGSEIQINGTTVIDSTGTLTANVDWGDVFGAPATIGETPCNDNQILEWQSNAWTCSDLLVDGAQITTGTIDVDRLPVGDSASDVAAGDHLHAFGDITGQVGFGQLPVGDTDSTVAVGSHTHAQPSDIDVTGGVTAGGLVTPGDDGSSCAGSTAGAIRFDAASSSLQFCDGSEWAVIGGGLGSAANPATSCKDILDNGASTGDGEYWIDPTGSRSFKVWCDMSTDGGGWTRFWWYTPGAGFSGVTDVLAGEVWDCDPSDARCMARMPITNPSELHVQNHRSQWGTWTFNGSTTSGKALASFTARTTWPSGGGSCADAWNPTRTVSGFNDHPYRCDEGTGGAADDCHCFWYTDYNGIRSINFDDDWGWAETAFTMGVDNGDNTGVDSFDRATSLGNALGHGLWLYYR